MCCCLGVLEQCAETSVCVVRWWGCGEFVFGGGGGLQRSWQAVELAEQEEDLHARRQERVWRMANVAAMRCDCLQLINRHLPLHPMQVPVSAC